MKFFTLLLIIYLLSGCDPERSTIYSTKDCLEKYQPGNIAAIVSSPEKYDHSYVEITGFYYWGVEQTSLSNARVSKYKSSLLWVDFNSSLIDSLENNNIHNENIFKNLTGRRIKIRGRIDSKDRGHLDQYGATIKNVCYLEVYKW